MVRPSPSSLTRTPRDGGAVLVIRALWWSHPAVIVVLVASCSTLLAVLAPDAWYDLWQTPRYIRRDDVLLVVLAVTAYVVGVAVAGGGPSGGDQEVRLEQAHLDLLRRALTTMLVVCSIGYVVWVVAAAWRGADLALVISVLRAEPGAVGALKQVSPPVSGLSTLTQVGPAAAAVWAVLRLAGRSGWRPLLWLGGLAAARALFYGERLALIEVAIPALVVFALCRRPGAPITVRPLLPFAAGPLLWAVFAGFEYTRSWQSQGTGSWWDFATYITSRLGAYYATTMNNSSLLANSISDRDVLPYYSFSGLWNLPGRDVLVDAPRWGGSPPPVWWTEKLALQANPDFTSVGTFLVTWGELGLVGMVAFWLSAGLATGALHALAARGSVPAVMAFSTVAIGLLEVSRVLYWVEGRFAPTAAALLLLAVAWRRHARVLVREDDDEPSGEAVRTGDARPAPAQGSASSNF